MKALLASRETHFRTEACGGGGGVALLPPPSPSPPWATEAKPPLGLGSKMATPARLLS